jgi:hypothetical protein
MVSWSWAFWEVLGEILVAADDVGGGISVAESGGGSTEFIEPG